MGNSDLCLLICLFTFAPLSAQNMFFLIFYSMDGGELFSRIQDRGDQAFTERGEECTHTHKQAAIITNVLYQCLKSNIIQNPLRGGKKEVSNIPTVKINISFFLFFKTVGNKWLEHLLAKAKTKVFTVSIEKIYSLVALEASDIMKSIGEAIEYLHAVNIAHRDVKVCITALRL